MELKYIYKNKLSSQSFNQANQGSDMVIACAASYASIMSGSCNYVKGGACYGSIFSGECNTVCANAINSAIFSGCNNCVSGCCSVILGGSGNSDGGKNYVGIFGCGITGVQSCALHANALVAQNMCNMTFGGPPPITGTLYYCVTGIGQCTVYIA